MIEENVSLSNKLVCSQNVIGSLNGRLDESTDSCVSGYNQYLKRNKFHFDDDWHAYSPGDVCWFFSFKKYANILWNEEGE